ncbi:MAG TPA: hydrogenase [Candidatus Tripitaka californicus]|uniref:hydrogenase n=1 Tax=Candidatus Tripitaka californicus TaxID=3367616 RepID=UPI004026B262|nr:hydrogenase [Planctomycetota bacterium]
MEGLIKEAYLIDKLAVSMLGVVMLMSLCGRLVTLVYVYAFQSLLLAAIAFFASYTPHSHHLIWMVYLIIIVKVIVIPYVFLRIIETLTIKKEVEPYVSQLASPLVASGLVILAYYSQQYVLQLHEGVVFSHCLSISIAVILIGFFLMITRKKAVTQMVGLMTMENGVFLCAMVLTSGMPMIIELGVSFDVLMGILIMGIFVFRIRETFASIDTSKLNSLRG